MKQKLLFPIIVFALLTALGISLTLPAQAIHLSEDRGDSTIIPGQYIVVFQEGSPGIKTLAKKMASKHRFGLGFIFRHAIQGFSAAIPGPILDKLKSDARIKYIEPDRFIYPFDEVLPPGQTLPTGVTRIKADLNATAHIDGFDERVDVDIAILDSGIDLDHPDLNVVEDISFVPFLTSGNDYYGHGTHVAGIAAAIDNGSGVVGVAPGARLHAVKVLDRLGLSGMSGVLAGIDWVTEHADEIEVVNMSIGTVGHSQAMRDAIISSVNKGVVFVAAAGNDQTDIYGRDGIFGTRDDVIPGSFPEVAAVSCLTDLDGVGGGLGGEITLKNEKFTDDTLAVFSNFSRSATWRSPVKSPGGGIDFAAPGVNIVSTYKNGEYYTASGTSMASPYAAGCVALYIAKYGRAHDAAGVAAIRQALIDLAEPQSSWGPRNTNDPDQNKEGLINADVFDPMGPPANLVSITLNPLSSSIPKGSSLRFTAMGSYDDNSLKDITPLVTWTSTDESVAVIDAQGLATGVAEGTTDIIAGYQGLSSEPVNLTVTGPVVKKIVITPQSASISVEDSQQYTAMEIYSDGKCNDVTNTATWTSSDGSVAVIDSTGLATGLGAGVTNITAELYGFTSNQVTLNVIPLGPVVAFADSFEEGLDLWENDTHEDWYISPEGFSTDGLHSAMVDGLSYKSSFFTRADINLEGRTEAVLTFDWMIGPKLDFFEYLALDLSSDGGNTWTEVSKLKGDVDPEDTWLSEEIHLDASYLTSGFKIRFRAFMTLSNEIATVDNIRVVAE